MWIWLRTIHEQKFTDQNLLREAVEQWRTAGEPGDGPNPQIFEQQAAQGYYDDAEATARLFRRPEERRWSVVELAKIRAENGDIEGAKQGIRTVVGSDLGAEALKMIALIQVDRGDLQGALATISPVGDPNTVRLAFARCQIAKGDFDGALKTAEEIGERTAYPLFYEIGDALRIRREQRRMRELAAGMRDRKLAGEFQELARFTLPEAEPMVVGRASPCEEAYFDATTGKFGNAAAIIERNSCSNVSFVTGLQYEVDPAEAEQLLRNKAHDDGDLARGLGHFATTAARKGNISEALRFLHDLDSNGTSDPSLIVREIARGWTIKDGSKTVISWARSRPTLGQRTWALIGTAEALGHARPVRSCATS